MALSARMRYEILRRDDFTCRYCGAKPPDVRLVVDHVVPESLGGSSTPDNLTCACVDCNSGKGSAPPESVKVAEVAADAERFAAAMAQAVQNRAQPSPEVSGYVNAFMERWPSYYGATDSDLDSVESFYRAGLPEGYMVSALGKAITATQVRGGPAKFRYFCGICWSMIRELQAEAADIMRQVEP